MAQADAAAMQRTVSKLHDMIPGNLIRRVVQQYEHELYLAELAKNPRVMALAGLKVHDPGIPWPYAYRKHGKFYLQSNDRVRAQALLDDQNAKWVVYSRQRRPSNDPADVMIQRVR
jgi:hypothetical protein